jgi:hypothetical protein
MEEIWRAIHHTHSTGHHVAHLQPQPLQILHRIHVAIHGASHLHLQTLENRTTGPVEKEQYTIQETSLITREPHRRDAAASPALRMAAAWEVRVRSVDHSTCNAIATATATALDMALEAEPIYTVAVVSTL